MLVSVGDLYTERYWNFAKLLKEVAAAAIVKMRLEDHILEI